MPPHGKGRAYKSGGFILIIIFLFAFFSYIYFELLDPTKFSLVMQNGEQGIHGKLSKWM